MKISNMSLLSCLLITSLLSTPVNAQNFREVDSSLKNSSAKSKLADPIYKIDDKHVGWVDEGNPTV